jgi:hypothetical protein
MTPHYNSEDQVSGSDTVLGTLKVQEAAAGGTPPDREPDVAEHPRLAQAQD